MKTVKRVIMNLVIAETVSDKILQTKYSCDILIWLGETNPCFCIEQEGYCCRYRRKFAILRW